MQPDCFSLNQMPCWKTCFICYPFISTQLCLTTCRVTVDVLSSITKTVVPALEACVWSVWTSSPWSLKKIDLSSNVRWITGLSVTLLFNTDHLVFSSPALHLCPPAEFFMDHVSYIDLVAEENESQGSMKHKKKVFFRPSNHPANMFIYTGGLCICLFSQCYSESQYYCISISCFQYLVTPLCSNKATKCFQYLVAYSGLKEY